MKCSRYHEPRQRIANPVYLRVWFVKLLGQSRIGTVESALLSDDISNLHRENFSVFGQVWDCHLGDVLWEGTGQMTAQTEVHYVGWALPTISLKCAPQSIEQIASAIEILPAFERARTIRYIASKTAEDFFNGQPKRLDNQNLPRFSSTLD